MSRKAISPKPSFNIFQADQRHKKNAVLTYLRFMRLCNIKLSQAKRIFLLDPEDSFSRFVRAPIKFTAGQVYVISLSTKIRHELETIMSPRLFDSFMHTKQSFFMWGRKEYPSHIYTSCIDYILSKEGQTAGKDYLIISRLTKLYYHLRRN